MSTENHCSQTLFEDTIKTYEQLLVQCSYHKKAIANQTGILKRIYNYGTDERLTYTYEKAKAWLKEQQKCETTGQISHAYYVRMRTSIEQFEQFCREGCLVIKKRIERPSCLPEYLHSIHKEFVFSLPQNLAPRTISIYDINSRQFFEYLVKHSIMDLKCIDYKTAKDFLADAATHHKGSMDKVLHTMKLLFIFFSDRGLVNFNPDFSFLKPAYRRKPVLPHFTYDEVNSILEMFDKSTAIGKRDYAFVLIAIYTGLRLGDIVNLRLTDIDWRHYEIRITQKKTGNKLCLPFSVEVGNALADYILNGRQSSEEECIFLKSVAPYTKLKSNGTGDRILKKCYALNKELAEKCKNKTIHSFRRSMGSWLSMEQTPLPLISEILGHTNLESSKFYLSYDNSSMSMCCLGLDGIPVLKEELI